MQFMLLIFLLFLSVSTVKSADSVSFTVSNSDVFATATINDIYFSLCDSNSNCGPFQIVQGGWNQKGATYSYIYTANNFISNIEQIYVVTRGSDDLCLKRVTLNGQRYDTPDSFFGTNIPVCIENDGELCDMMVITLSNNGWSEPPCTFTYNQLYGITTTQPTQSTTKQSSQSPSKYPSQYPSKTPTEIPSISPTESSTMQPTIFPTKPSIMALSTIRPSPNNYMNGSSETSNVQTTEAILTVFLSLNENQIRVIWIVGIICASLFVICLIYLLVFARKRSKELGQMTKLDFIKETGIFFKIGILFSFVDIVTDYLYALSLILQNIEESIQFLGWISLISGSIGTTLFIFHIVFARKIFSKIPDLKIKLHSTINSSNKQNISNINDVLHEIRARKVDIGVFAILIVCIEDIPQITIIFLVNSMLKSWTHISILALSMSIISCLMKFLTIIMDRCGCGDDTVNRLKSVNYDPIQSDLEMKSVHSINTS